MQPDKRTLKRKLKSNPASTTVTTSGGESSGNSSSISSDQSCDTLPVYSSEEEDNAPSVVTCPKQQLLEKELQPNHENASYELPDHKDEATNGEESTEEEGGGM